MKVFRIGLMGERRAARYLRLRGMRLLERRYRTRHGEIDLILRDGTDTVFVEVKARPRGAAGDGFAAINAEKRRRLRLAAECYLALHPAQGVRFDAVEITAEGLRHIKNAF